VKGSADAWSDHHLVVAEVKRNLLSLKKEGSTRRNYCIYKLKDQRVKHEFLIALANSYDACTTDQLMNRR